MLSNLLLKRFDEFLVRHGVHAIRYADDIAIFGENRQQCLDGLRMAQTALAKLSLDLPELAEAGKTKLLGPSDSALFLGLDIRRFRDGYQLRAPTKKLEKIDASMAEIASLERCIREQRDFGKVARSLESLIIGHAASMAVLEDGGEFRNELEARKRRQLRHLMATIIGEQEVLRLDPGRLAVLGLQPF